MNSLEELPHVNSIFLSSLSTYLDQNLNNTNIKAGIVAEALAISKSTLNRKLKAIKGKSIAGFIKEYRLQKSAVILSAGYSIHETSNRVGFKTASYFTQCFKAYYHQTPSEFARQANKPI